MDPAVENVARDKENDATAGEGEEEVEAEDEDQKDGISICREEHRFTRLFIGCRKGFWWVLL